LHRSANPIAHERHGVGEKAFGSNNPTLPEESVHCAWLAWLIPLMLFRNPIERVLLRKARWEVQKNLSRVAADWRDRVAKIINELTGQAEKQALDELAALEQTLAQTASKAPELAKAIREQAANEYRKSHRESASSRQ
jgi:hypothetical protein